MVSGLGAAAVLLAAFPLIAQDVRVYVGRITPQSVLLAWGATVGRSENTIGRDSVSLGPAEVRLGGRTLTTGRNWIEVSGLTPDTRYDYEILIKGRRVGGGEVQTYPERAARLAFFVIGDYGNGSPGQRAVAEAMWREFERRAQSGNPVRFVLTVGDNIYADIRLPGIDLRSGDADRDWEPKFFGPYRELIRRIPFYPTLGNHDGNATENRGDLPTYLDNFFFPDNRPERWYEFSYGGLADFFALDTTENTLTGPPAPVYLPAGEQSRWLARALPQSKAPWKIPYFHHPPFTAGPEHPPSRKALEGWLDLFQKNGVRVVFSGHEHNFQFSEDSGATGHIRYIVSGAGGSLRRGNVERAMAAAHIEGWAAMRHFLAVEIDGAEMRVTPIAPGGMDVRDRHGNLVPLPLVIRLR
jgi:hypothetical protein